MTRSRKLLVLLVALLVALYAAIALFQHSQQQGLNQVSRHADRDVTWSVSQLEVEYYRFAWALDRRLLAPDS